MRRHGGRTGLLATVVAMLALPAAAQAEPSGNAFEFARESVVDEPEVASAQAGRAFTAWSTGGDPAFRVLSTSAPIGNRLQASAGGVLGNTGRIAANPRLGQYLHVWRTFSADFSQTTMYAQRRTASGAPVAPPVVLHQVEFAGIVVHDLVWNPRTRRYLVLWAVTDDAPRGLWATLLDESGNKIAGDVFPDVVGDASSAGVAVRPSGGYVVTWADGVFFPETQHVRANHSRPVAGRRGPEERFGVPDLEAQQSGRRGDERRAVDRD